MDVTSPSVIPLSLTWKKITNEIRDSLSLSERLSSLIQNNLFCYVRDYLLHPKRLFLISLGVCLLFQKIQRLLGSEGVGGLLSVFSEFQSG